MDIDQLQKRIQWVEEDRRKEKDLLSLLENRLVSLEGNLSASLQQGKGLSGEITRLSAVIARMDQYDQALVKARMENKQAIDDLDKTVKIRIEESEKVQRVQVKSFDASFADLQKQLEVIPKLEKNIQARIDVEINIRRSLDELREKIDSIRIEEEEYTRTVRLLEDGRRRDAMTTFLNKQAVSQVERDRTWKEWQSRFDTIENQAVDIESQLVSLDTTHREVKRIQGSIEELSQRVERRITEITEIQRLSEDRFRQEWVTFKADDQKRWTNYTLTQEEQRNEAGRQYGKLAEQTTHLEDELQEVKDLLQQANELVEKRLQSILAIAHEWVTTFERTMGDNR